MTRLSVNLDKVALVRNARGGTVPDLVEAACSVIAAGAGGLTIHPREDERHALLDDVFRLAELEPVASGRIELNVEGDPRPELLRVVAEAGAHQFTVVPVEPGELTTHHGWHRREDADLLAETVRYFEGQGGRTRVSVFVDPEPAGVELAAEVGAAAIELHTFAWAEAFGTPRQEEVVERFARMARLARERGLAVHAGHDLDLANLPLLLERLRPDEVSIGHALVSRAVSAGLPGITEEYLALVEAAGDGGGNPPARS